MYQRPPPQYRQRPPPPQRNLTPPYNRNYPPNIRPDRLSPPYNYPNRRDSNNERNNNKNIFEPQQKPPNISENKYNENNSNYLPDRSKFNSNQNISETSITPLSLKNYRGGIKLGSKENVVPPNYNNPLQENRNDFQGNRLGNPYVDPRMNSLFDRDRTENPYQQNPIQSEFNSRNNENFQNKNPFEMQIRGQRENFNSFQVENQRKNSYNDNLNNNNMMMINTPNFMLGSINQNERDGKQHMDNKLIKLGRIEEQTLESQLNSQNNQELNPYARPKNMNLNNNQYDESQLVPNNLNSNDNIQNFENLQFRQKENEVNPLYKSPKKMVDSFRNSSKIIENKVPIQNKYERRLTKTPVKYYNNSGLEKLEENTTIFMRKQFLSISQNDNVIEESSNFFIFPGTTLSNQILNNPLFYVLYNNDMKSKYCFSSCRDVSARVIHARGELKGQEFLEIIEENLLCGEDRILIYYTEEGHKFNIGFLSSQIGLFSKTFEVCDQNSHVKFLISINFSQNFKIPFRCQCEDCSFIRIDVLSPDNVFLSKFEKQRNTCCFLSDSNLSDQFQLEFPSKADQIEKSLLLSAFIYIQKKYFEG